MARIVKGDLIKIIAGSKKGTTGKVLKVNTATGSVLIEGVGLKHRHVKPTQLNPRGGKKDIHVPMDISKVALVVDEKTNRTSRVGLIKKVDGGKARVAKGYLFLTIDIDRFIPLERFRSSMDTLIRDIRSCERAEGVDRIYVPGEIEHLRRAERLRDGIPLDDALVRELEDLGRPLGLGALA